MILRICLPRWAGYGPWRRSFLAKRVSNTTLKKDGLNGDPERVFMSLTEFTELQRFFDQDL